jgi:hypothetical protein
MEPKFWRNIFKVNHKNRDRTFLQKCWYGISINNLTTQHHETSNFTRQHRSGHKLRQAMENEKTQYSEILRYHRGVLLRNHELWDVKLCHRMSGSPQKTDISNGCDISIFKNSVVHEEFWTLEEQVQ